MRALRWTVRLRQYDAMKGPTAAAFVALCTISQLGSAFVPPKPTLCARGTSPSETQLFGTIRFVGDASARLETPSTTLGDQDEDNSLSAFLTSSASDGVLLGAKKGAGAISECTKMDADGGSGELWECRQASIDWFGMTLTPVFTNRIEKNESSQNVVISIIDAQTEVQQGGRLGNTLASAMKRSEFEGRNAVSWTENGSSQSYTLDGNLKLTLTINLPPFLPLPPG